MRRPTFALLALAALACTPAAPRPVTRDAGASSGVAALDSATAHRLCARPDSVVAARRASCELRDQRPPVRVF